MQKTLVSIFPLFSCGRKLMALDPVPTTSLHSLALSKNTASLERFPGGEETKRALSKKSSCCRIGRTGVGSRSVRLVALFRGRPAVIGREALMTGLPVTKSLFHVHVPAERLTDRRGGKHKGGRGSEIFFVSRLEGWDGLVRRGFP